MDYEFFIEKLCDIPLDVVEELQKTYASYSNKSKDNSFWNKDRHRGITGVRFGRPYVVDIECLLLDDAFRTAIRPATFFNHELDILEPNGLIEWHTDTTTIHQRCAETHRVHVPLTNADQAFYDFKRDRNSPVVTMQMEIGSVYLFNNHVQHRVRNIGPLPRKNLMLNYEANHVRTHRIHVPEHDNKL